jgi:uncharacterized protein (TIRG00374 family)
MQSSPVTDRGRGKWVKLGLGLLISAIFLYVTFATVDFARVGAVLLGADPRWLGAAAAFLVLAYALKILRWTTMLRSLGARIGFADAAPPFLGGIAFNNVLPLRAGDIIRVVAFQRFTGIAPSGQLGTLLLERLLDLFVLMTILFATISFWQIDAIDGTLLSALRYAALAIAAAILLFIAAPHVIRSIVRWVEARLPRLRQAGEALLRLSEALATLSRPGLLFQLTLLSFLAWLAEGGIFYAVGQALDVAPTVQAALLALSLGTLSTIIPSSPGYVGTFHYFTAQAIGALGADRAGAAAYALLVHALLWLVTTITGFILLAVSGMTGGRAAASAPTNKEFVQ